MLLNQTSRALLKQSDLFYSATVGPTTLQKITSPFVMIIFGATGDLTQRKLIPALFHLFQKGELPEHFYIVGFSRRPYTAQDFKDFLTDAIKKYHGHEFNEILWEKFAGKCYYQQGNFDQIQGYTELIEKLQQFDTLLQACVPRFFYLATPPDNYGAILKFLHETKLSEGCGQGSDKWTKVLIEKPFGKSLKDAQVLDNKLAQTFKEEQIYRIDHYLGKETVQNILAFRFGNTIFDPVWNSQYIDHVQITIAETNGVETRGNFYEGVGALRDMAQSHLLELMTAITMEQPQTFDAEGIRNKRTKSIELIQSIAPGQTALLTVRGQYNKGIIKSQTGVVDVLSYRQEANVANNSNTETFVALKLLTSDSKWYGVPFYLRTGKRLAKQTTEIAVVFKQPHLKMFGKKNVDVVANILSFRIGPNEGIELTLNAKQVGLETVFEQVPMNFSYQKERGLPEAYERLLIDAMRGDQTLFTRTDEVVASWKLISFIAQGWWNQGDPHFPNYAAGSWGPKAATELIKRDQRDWLLK